MNLNELIKNFGLNKLNSLTKYPSIYTYHPLEKGKLINEVNEGKKFDDLYYVTEKIDGTNGRIVLLNGDFLIGSREEILTAKGDRVVVDALGIVDAVSKHLDKLVYLSECNEGYMITIYGEVYGKVGNAAKNYSNGEDGNDFRIFDIVFSNVEHMKEVLAKDIEDISSWREHEGQEFCLTETVKNLAEEVNIERVPYLLISEEKLPEDIVGMYEFLCEFPNTVTDLGINGLSEGIVIRNGDRSLIRKIRFEDYEKRLFGKFKDELTPEGLTKMVRRVK